MHVDAHIDLEVFHALPAGPHNRRRFFVGQLKRELEKNLCYRGSIRTSAGRPMSGNYIFPALQEGIVRDFYWVVRGTRSDFLPLGRTVRKILAG